MLAKGPLLFTRKQTIEWLLISNQIKTIINDRMWVMDMTNTRYCNHTQGAE